LPSRRPIDASSTSNSLPAQLTGNQIIDSERVLNEAFQAVPIMPPKMPAGKVSDVVPSKDEEDHAEQVYANATAKEKHSISMAMNHFVKANQDSVTSLAEGPLKKKFIKNFLVLQFRHKKGYKKMQTSNEIANTNSRFSDTVPMSQHKIYKEMGKTKGDLS